MPLPYSVIYFLSITLNTIMYIATCLLILKCDRLGHIWRFIKKKLPLFSVQILCSSQFCFNILNCIVLLQKFTIVTFYFWYIFYFLCKKVRVDWLLVYLVYKWCIYCHVQHIIGSVGNRKSNGVTSSLCITTLQVFIVHKCDFL